MRTLLITGASGYIGGNLIKHFLDTYPDSSIRIIGTTTSLSKTEKFKNPYFKQVEWIPFNLEKPLIESKIIRECDALIHLASLNNSQCISSFDYGFRSNVEGSKYLLDLALNSPKIKSFIYMSTFHVYEKGQSYIDESSKIKEDHKLIDEEGPILTKQNGYSKGHFLFEQILLKANSNFKKIIFRLSNSLGPPLDPDTNVWMLVACDLCLQAIKQKKMVLHSHGRQTRNFIAISDVVRSIDHVLNCDSIIQKREIYNLGGEETISIIKLCEIIQNSCKELFTFAPEIIFGTTTSDSVSVDLRDEIPFYFSCKSLQETNFSYKSSIEEAVRSLLLFCHKNF